MTSNIFSETVFLFFFSVLRAVGAIFFICYSLDNQMKVHIVLVSSTVIFTAVSYDVLILII